MVETIFSSPFAQAVLVFVLVFVIIFAILQKSKLFGEGKKQIDALISLSAGLIAVFSTSYARELIGNIIPFLAVALVVIFVFLVLIGSFFPEGKFEVPNWLKLILGIISFIAVVLVVLYYSGGLDSLFKIANEEVILNVIFIIIIIGAIVAVILGGKSKKE